MLVSLHLIPGEHPLTCGSFFTLFEALFSGSLTMVGISFGVPLASPDLHLLSCLNSGNPHLAGGTVRDPAVYPDAFIHLLHWLNCCSVSVRLCPHGSGHAAECLGCRYLHSLPLV